MSFIDWFKTDGDKLCNFVSVAALALTGVKGMPPEVAGYALIAGVLATAAHQSFFPNTPQERLK